MDNRIIYEAPESTVLELKTESVILQMSTKDYDYGGLDEVMMDMMNL